MATAYKFALGPNDVGKFHHGGYNAEASAKASEVMQWNLESWNIHFSGLRHNHIVHGVLTILGLGGTAADIQKFYEREAAYQMERYPVDENVIEAMKDKEHFKTYLDQLPQYSNFLLFFQRQIESKGVRQTLEEHLFANDDHANRLFPRLFCSIFHAYLHLGFALEYNQPAIIAEGLAMASIHDPDANKIAPIYLEAERLAGAVGQLGKKTLRQVMEELRGANNLRSLIDGDDKIDRSKNVADNAMKKIVEHAAQYSISDSQLEDKITEMIDTCALLIATKPSPLSNSQSLKIDFFLLHTVNTLVLTPAFVNHEWIGRANAIRMVEWAGRCHILTYMSQTAPPLTSAEIDNYPVTRSWEQLFERSINHPSDDGHLTKCVRSLAYGDIDQAKKEHQEKGAITTATAKENEGLQIKGDSWLRLANLVVDHVPYTAKTSAERWLLAF